jgi:hypothetical protein
VLSFVSIVTLLVDEKDRIVDLVCEDDPVDDLVLEDDPVLDDKTV